MRCEVKLENCIICFKKCFKKYTRKPTGRIRINGTQYLEKLDFAVQEVGENLMEMKNNCLGYGGILLKTWDMFSKS